MEYSIKAIPVKYKGRQYRSMLEAKWAAFFDLLGWRFEYEPFELDHWFPDFAIFGEKTIVVEVKPIDCFDKMVADRIEIASDRQFEILLLGLKPELDEEFNGCQAELWWDEDLTFDANCSDLFFWGCADSEDINEEDLPLLRQSLEDSESHGMLLYCARKRKMRPQGAYYTHLREDEALFDVCGPERKTGIGNPKHQSEES